MLKGFTIWRLNTIKRKWLRRKSLNHTKQKERGINMNFKEILIKQYESLSDLYEVEIWENTNEVYVWNKEDKNSITYKFDNNNNLMYTY